jgi:hypothetical protein
VHFIGQLTACASMPEVASRNSPPPDEAGGCSSVRSSGKPDPSSDQQTHPKTKLLLGRLPDDNRVESPRFRGGDDRYDINPGCLSCWSRYVISSDDAVRIHCQVILSSKRDRGSAHLCKRTTTSHRLLPLALTSIIA